MSKLQTKYSSKSNKITTTAISELTNKLREIEAHHLEQNFIRGRPESRSKTLRLTREALAMVAKLS